MSGLAAPRIPAGGRRAPRGAGRPAGPPAAPRDPALLAGALAAVVTAIALWIFRRALDGYFSPDEFIFLERARGLATWAATPWRALSGPAYWNAALRLFGTDPAPYHAVVWTLHGLNVLLLFSLARRLGSSLAVATLAAGLFGATRLSYVAVYLSASVGELASLALALGALLVALGRLRTRAPIAAAMFACALLCKESVAPLPLVLLFVRAHGTSPADAVGARLRARFAVVLPLLVVNLAFAALLFAFDRTPGGLGGPAYAWRLGSNLVLNLGDYAAAALDLATPAPDPALALHTVAGLVALALLAIAASVVWRRSRLPALGLAGFVLGLATVLPLVTTRNLHYLYSPTAFLALAVASLAFSPLEAAWSAPAAARRAAIVAALVLVSAHAALTESRLAARHAARTATPPLAQDNLLRRWEFARNVVESLRRQFPRDTVRLGWIRPEGTTVELSARTGEGLAGAPAARAPRVDFADAVLDHGRAIPAMLPNVRDVLMTRGWEAALAGRVLFTNEPSGRPVVLGRAPRAHRLVARLWERNARREEAIRYLEGAIAAGEGGAEVESTLAGLRARAGAR